MTGLATIAEIHYVTTLGDPDRVGGTTGALSDVAGSDSTFLLNNGRNPRDAINCTLGLHVEINDWMNIRIGEAFALNDVSDRAVDSAFLVQINVEL